MQSKEIQLNAPTPTQRTSPSKPRNLYLDSLRGLAVYLVILGHSMANYTMAQYQEGLFWLDPWHIAIYSFHMPLFALISGYFFVKALAERSPKAFVLGKLPSLLAPWVLWGAVTWCIKAWQGGFSMLQAKAALVHILGIYWFIPAIAAVMLLTWAIYRYFSRPWLVCLLLLLVLQLLPASKVPMYDFLRIKQTTFLFPFFVLALEFRRHQDFCMSLFERYRYASLLLALGAYGLLLWAYDKDTYMYFSGVSLLDSSLGLWGQAYVNLSRWVIGVLGSFLVAYVVYLLRNTMLMRIVAQLGTMSLGVYLLQEVLLAYGVRVYSLGAYIPYPYLSMFVISILVSVLCWGIIRLGGSLLPRSWRTYIFGR